MRTAHMLMPPLGVQGLRCLTTMLDVLDVWVDARWPLVCVSPIAHLVFRCLWIGGVLACYSCRSSAAQRLWRACTLSTGLVAVRPSGGTPDRAVRQGRFGGLGLLALASALHVCISANCASGPARLRKVRGSRVQVRIRRVVTPDDFRTLRQQHPHQAVEFSTISCIPTLMHGAQCTAFAA